MLWVCGDHAGPAAKAAPVRAFHHAAVSAHLETSVGFCVTAERNICASELRVGGVIMKEASQARGFQHTAANYTQMLTRAHVHKRAPG